MLKLEPEIDLPNELELSCPEEVYSWLEKNRAGMRYIVIEQYLGRNKYNRISKIFVQDNPSMNERPRESVEDIIKIIYLILQYQLEERDESGKYKIAIYKTSNRGPNKVVSKHVEVGTNYTDVDSSTTFDPDKVDTDIVSTLMNYIQSLHDQIIGLNSVTVNVIKPLADQNKEMTDIVRQFAFGQVEIARMQLQSEALKEATEHEAQLEAMRIKSNEKKRQEFFLTLKQTGALDGLLSILNNKLNGTREVPKKKSPTKEEVEKEIKNQMEKEPLRMMVNTLGNSLEQGDTRDKIKEILKEETFDNFMKLLDSNSEELAIENLKSLIGNIDSDDLEGLNKINEEVLNNQQRQLVNHILSFDMN